MGSIQLSEVTHEGVAAWVSELSNSGLAPATVRQAHRVLSLILSLAIRDGRLARNPAERVPLPRAQTAERMFLTMDQVDPLADAAGGYRTTILFLAYTGVRSASCRCCACEVSTCSGAGPRSSRPSQR